MKKLFFNYKVYVTLILVTLMSIFTFLPIFSFYGADIFEKDGYIQQDGPFTYDVRLAGKTRVSLFTLLSAYADKDVRTIIKIKKIEGDYYSSIINLLSDIKKVERDENGNEIVNPNEKQDEINKVLKDLSSEDIKRIHEKLKTPQFMEKLSVRFAHSNLILENGLRMGYDDEPLDGGPAFSSFLFSNLFSAFMYNMIWYIMLHLFYIVVAIFSILSICSNIYYFIKYGIKEKNLAKLDLKTENEHSSFSLLGLIAVYYIFKLFIPSASMGLGLVMMLVLLALSCLTNVVSEFLGLKSKKIKKAFIINQCVSVVSIVMCIIVAKSFSALNISKALRYISLYANEKNFVPFIVEILCIVVPILAFYIITRILLRSAKIEVVDDKGREKSNDFRILAIVMLIAVCSPFILKSNDFNDAKTHIIFKDAEMIHNSAEYISNERMLNYLNYELDNYEADEHNPYRKTILKNELKRYNAKADIIASPRTIDLIVALSACTLLIVFEFIYHPTNKKYYSELFAYKKLEESTSDSDQDTESSKE